jgi:hypothetical protein
VGPIGATGSSQTGNVLLYNTSSKEVIYSSGKTFVIDHPTSPHKYLVHGCLEGPELGIYQRGSGFIDATKLSTTIHLSPFISQPLEIVHRYGPPKSRIINLPFMRILL